MTRLRIALPPLATLDTDSLVDFAWQDRNGQVSAEGQGTLAHVAGTAGSVAVECYLHPLDSVVMSMDLPQLPAAKMTAAVGCAAQALILGNVEHMFVAHSARDSQGRVQIAWLSRADLERLGQLLREAQLKLRGLYPAPYALPVSDDGAAVACLQHEHLLVRHSMQCTTVHPAADEALDNLLADGTPLQWVGDTAPANVTGRLPAVQRWTGPAPDWGLHGGVQTSRAVKGGWGKVASVCVLAVLVWIVGLNLYAEREAHQGRQLKSDMSLRVKQAFPELPVILNPLQQARQQLAARQNGASQSDARAFHHLLQQAGNAMPFMNGRLQALSFSNGELHLDLLPGSRKVVDDSWQAVLAQAGISATANAGGWTLRTVSATRDDAQAAVGADDE
ncbi:type II secretion system protein GspL [Pseudomonas sp. NPDC089734]|uniref:type II secretion system protein GspL n=1 Tax=Pseudomonas sp. NPDC089734 TaxID=3364469 RepID=UPI00380C1BAF